MNLGSITIKLDDKTKKAIEANEEAKFHILTAIGIKAKQNSQAIIKIKNIYNTGELYRTMDYNVNLNKSSVDIGSPKNYAVFNELGTRRMNARPFLAPAILYYLNDYKEIAQDILKKTFK